MNVFGFGYALVAFAVMGFIPMIAADSNLMSSKNWTEENIVSLFRSHGENFCAQTDVCGNNRSTKANVVNDSELTSCCDDCYCDDDCEFYDDCCFKREYSPHAHEKKECLYALSDQTIDINTGYEAFYMVTSCNKTINCYDLQQNPWGPLLPVFSPSLQNIYMNMPCAICNGVNDGKEWDANVDFNNLSPSDIDTIFSAIKFRTFTANCHAQFTYPYDDINMVQTLQCFKKAPIESCPNKTALGNTVVQYIHQFNLDQNSIVDLCSSAFFSVYVYAKTKRISYYYKNVFCFICNHNKIPSNVCSPESKFGIRYTDIKFVLLVQWTHDVAYVDKLPFTTKGLKNDNHYRAMHCPVGQERNIMGKCINALPKFPSSEVGLFLKLYIPEPIRLPNGTTEKDIKLFFEGIEFLIETSMSINTLNELANYFKESDFVIIDYFAIVVRLLKIPTPSVLMSQINQFLNSNFTVRFNGTSIQCKQVLMPHSVRSLAYLHEKQTKHNLEFVTRLYNLVIIDNYKPLYKTHILNNMLLIGKVFFCPLIEFAEEEVNIMYDGHLLYIAEYATYFGDMEFVTSIDIAGNGTVKVCWDDKIFQVLKQSVLINMATNTTYPITLMYSIAFMIYSTLHYYFTV